MNRDKTLKLVEAVTLYSAGIDHARAMDWLTMECTEYEWKLVCTALDVVDEIHVDNGIGTIYQTEKILSSREHRENRYPPILRLYGPDIHKQRSEARIAAIADEFRRKGIKFRET